ncbi:MAG: branched-chain amino acid ABC transporter permease [Salinarimonadaceae bacterium]|nr:MAG: branched-chain amino acid ABC transporter permease [Salinarimonadaceae bacterium]
MSVTTRNGMRDRMFAAFALVATTLLCFAFGRALLTVNDERIVVALLVTLAAGIVLAERRVTRAPDSALVRGAVSTAPAAVLLAIVALILVFHANHFALLLICTLLIYVTVALGLHLQFGYAGVLNFAGAAFFGIGCYTAAVLTQLAWLPHPVVMVLGGVFAALIGLALLPPVLRTRGHYASVVTIAFGVLFTTFLEINETFGGAQGMHVAGLSLFGFDMTRNIRLSPGVTLSFYFGYAVVALLLAVGAFALVTRIERSWIGLTLDAVRLDETRSACFGIDLARWKIFAFCLGNFIIGVAGALFGMLMSFIAPPNFSFSASLMLVAIIILGGIGNRWGVLLGATLIVLVPERLQTIQEYRVLLFAALIVGLLLIRPNGLAPRRMRRYFGEGSA